MSQNELEETIDLAVEDAEDLIEELDENHVLWFQAHLYLRELRELRAKYRDI